MSTRYAFGESLLQSPGGNLAEVDTDGNQFVRFGVGSTLDAFTRLRVSNPTVIFDSKQLYDTQTLVWDDAQTSGAGTTTTYNTNQASTTIAVSNATAGVRKRQTRRWFNYQPGKSQLIMMTGVIGSGGAGITKRLGLLNDQNGYFFEQSGTTMRVVRRTFVTGVAVDNTTDQTSWNIDPMNGSGPSGVILDITKAQIFLIDFQWLGAGSVRFGFVINGQIYYVHQLNNANSLSTVSISTPNLPLRYEITNDGTGGANSLTHICATVISEGGSERTGAPRSVNRTITGLVTGAASTAVLSLIGIRLKSTHLGATVIPTSVNIIVTTNQDFRWQLILNPTVAGVDAAVWTAVTNSAIEFDVSRTTANTLSGGTVLASGYGVDAGDTINFNFPADFALGSTISGTPSELVLSVQNVVASNETYFGSINYLETY